MHFVIFQYPNALASKLEHRKTGKSMVKTRKNIVLTLSAFFKNALNISTMFFMFFDAPNLLARAFGC